MGADVETFDFGEARPRTAPPDSSTGHDWAWSESEGWHCRACGARPHWPIGRARCVANSTRRIPRDWKPPAAAQEVSIMPKPSTLTDEQKRAAVARLDAGESAVKIAAELGVSDGAIYWWRKRCREEGGTPATPKARPTRTAAPKGSAVARLDEEDAELELEIEEVPKRPSPSPRPSATKIDPDALDLVEDLGLEFTRSLAVLAIIEARAGAAGVESLQQARDLIDREIERRRAS